MYSIGSVPDVYAVSIVSQPGLAADILHRIGWPSVPLTPCRLTGEFDPHQMIDYGVRVSFWTVCTSQVENFLLGSAVRKQNGYGSRSCLD